MKNYALSAMNGNHYLYILGIKMQKIGCKVYVKNVKQNTEKKNRKKINKNHQRYYQEHKEEIIKKQKQYYYDNRENELQKRKQYQIDYADHIAEIKKQYNEENKEKIAQKNKEYYENNREHKILVQHEYYNIHRDKLLEQKHQYYIDHKDEIITKNQIRRSMVNNAEGEFTKEQVSECINFFDGVCAYSGDVFSEDDRFKCLSLDHIVAITNGGVNYIWNIVPTTFSHNSSKGTKDMIE